MILAVLGTKSHPLNSLFFALCLPKIYNPRRCTFEEATDSESQSNNIVRFINRLLAKTWIYFICTPCQHRPFFSAVESGLVPACCVEWGLIQVHVIGSYFQVIMLFFSKGGFNHHLYTS